MKPYTFEKSEALFERAKKVIPGGIYGHQSPLFLTRGAYPSFFARGEGSHVWDVDGNEYIDYMCSYGPIVLGHRHPRVEEAVRRQGDLGNCVNAPIRTSSSLKLARESGLQRTAEAPSS